MRPVAFAAILTALGAGCAGISAVPVAAVPLPSLHVAGLRGPVDPTLRGARFVPGSLARARAWGTQPGGGQRSIEAGPDERDPALRVVAWPDGSIVVASQRLPAGPSAVVDVPERMGGGLLYAIGEQLWRSDTWLGVAHPLLTTSAKIASVQVGLDRIYLRSAVGALGAIDPRTGMPMDMGPLPASPSVPRLAALDAWHAVALADLRGLMFTSDAGSRWRPLPVPIAVTDIHAASDAFVLGGLDAEHQVEWWEVTSDGTVGRLTAPPHGPEGPAPADAASSSVKRMLGDRPLATAIADGWPLVDGTALVARDGWLARVRMSDGAVVETVPGAYPLAPSRCHPLLLPTAADPGSFGFVCGEPRGRTAVYRWQPAEARLRELRAFAGPREVIASANGALLVRGPCGPDAPVTVPPDDAPWCVMAANEAWHDVVLRGDDVDRARLVALADGRLVVVRPPRDGDLSSGRLTVSDGTRATHVPIVMPTLQAQAARALRLGIWRDGFEERRPGVFGGWVDVPATENDHVGAVVGVQIRLDGTLRMGELLRDAGPPLVSGRWAFGWSTSRHGVESTDGGMSWSTGIDLPAPMASGPGLDERACGPLGCLAGGWLRVGWGATDDTAAEPEPPVLPRWGGGDMPSLELTCEATSGPPPEPRAPATSLVHAAHPPTPVAMHRSWILPAAPTATCSGQPSSFQGRPGPTTGRDDCLLQIGDVTDRAFARVYAWGPRDAEWDGLGKWKVAWIWPFGGWPDARASASTAAPWLSRDAAARALGIGLPMPSPWTLVPGDDPDHALLVERRQQAARSVELTVLEADHPPVPLHGPGGDAFVDFQGAVRIAGRWYVATSQAGAGPSATLVWAVDGNAVREIARLPRVGNEGAARLARRVDGAALGVVVDGQATRPDRLGARWVAAIDLESGAVSEPELLAPVDRSDASGVTCTGDDDGWEVDLPYGGEVRLLGAPAEDRLRGVVARLRLSYTHSCIERLGGSVDGDRTTLAQLVRHPAEGLRGRPVDVGVSASRARYGLKCTVVP